MPRSGWPVALVASACRFPDAATPAQLLSNTLEGRQSFRAIPPERLVLEDYAEARIGVADSITPVPAGLLTNWHFDLARFRIPRGSYESADPAHWLALEVTADLIDGIGGVAFLDCDRTAVVVANTLTGELSRTRQLRLRWPWLDSALREALAMSDVAEGNAILVRHAFRSVLQRHLGAPDEEMLAGGLANTIAGRIANFFDLHAGAWSVDAACASSLVAVAEAAELIQAGRAEAVIVAGVDLSLDPFELVGFSRNGALAPTRMRVFDARAEGFWPGEGAGAVLLMNLDQARRRLLPVKAIVSGWGVATDGSGGLTRPEVAGQRRALERAFVRAQRDPSELAFVEAHGTGTAVGDPVEVRALAGFLSDRSKSVPVASVKGNIGHTKAAAGMAGLIRTVEAMVEGLIPPHAGCEHPHPVFAETGERIRVASAPETWPRDRPIAGVSAFGFGGVNAHVVLERQGPTIGRPVPIAPPMRDAELFLFRGAEAGVVDQALERLSARAAGLSLAELADAAAMVASDVGSGPVSLAFIASTPGELVTRIDKARAAIRGQASPTVAFGYNVSAPRIGLAFPGQAAPIRSGGAWIRRFPTRGFQFQAASPSVRTDVAQPAIASASLVGIEFLEAVGVAPCAAIGHSLGELAALAWANSIPRGALQELVAARGAAMAALPPGAMVRLNLSPEEARLLIKDLPLTLACFNAPTETIIAGDFAAIDKLEALAAQGGVEFLRLSVSHAFHSPSMSGAVREFQASLAAIPLNSAEARVASTVMGDWLTTGVDIQSLLVDQLTAPVRFWEAARVFADAVDLVVEVGPGAGISRLLEGLTPCVRSLDVGAESMVPALETLAMIHAAGGELTLEMLFEGPGVRPLSELPPTLLSSPCGGTAKGDPPLRVVSDDVIIAAAPNSTPASQNGDVLSLLMGIVARETGLEESALSPGDRFLDDLHLNSLSVSRLLSRLAEAIGRHPPKIRTAFSNASLEEVAESFEEAEALGDQQPQTIAPVGPAPWVRRFALSYEPVSTATKDAVRWRQSDDKEAATTIEPDDGLILELPPEWDAMRDAGALVEACQAAASRYSHLAILHNGAPLSGFARSIAAERLFKSVRLIDGPPASEILARGVDGFEELIFRAGVWVTPRLTLIDKLEESHPPPSGAMLVTGGARGIAAECAIRIAERWKVPLILAGRTSKSHPEVEATLDRISAIGVAAEYIQSDVADAAVLRRRVKSAADRLGQPISVLVHAAGVNRPIPFSELTADLLSDTLTVKARGLQAAVEACGTELRRVVAFGSIIARLGLAGEAHYALANAEQGRLLDAIGAERRLSCLSIDWSIWAGAGMGERLGTIDRLAGEGVEAISLDAALSEFESLALAPVEGALIVTGRYGASDELSGIAPSRFVERVLTYTPEVELVCETELSVGRDPYLADHVLEGLEVVPGVLLLEAMAQAAEALGGAIPQSLANVRFNTAVINQTGRVKIRIGVLREVDGSIRAEVRSAEDSFARPAAVARFVAPMTPPQRQPHGDVKMDGSSLYGSLLFQGKRFRRVASVGALSSRKVAASFGSADAQAWFSSFEPQRLVLGDPGIRDASLHVLQCCVPHRRLLPVAVERIDRFEGGVPVRMCATERWCHNDDYAFDILQIDAADRVVERWSEAMFRATGPLDRIAILAAAPQLTGPFLERRARELTHDDSIAVVLVDDAHLQRKERRAQAASALGFAFMPTSRGDGKPHGSLDGCAVSFAHSDGITLGVRSSLGVGCDVERVDQFSSVEAAEDWTAEETLRKLGSTGPLARSATGIFCGMHGEQIAALGPVETLSAGLITIAVGVTPKR